MTVRRYKIFSLLSTCNHEEKDMIFLFNLFSFLKEVTTKITLS